MLGQGRRGGGGEYNYVTNSYRSFDDAAVIYGICWTTDLDYFMHMNNGKYFREMDFGRFDWCFRSGVTQYIASKPGMYAVQHGSCIRYQS